MSMPEFDFVEPVSVSEACSLLAEDPEGSVVFAGGTDILVDSQGRCETSPAGGWCRFSANRRAGRSVDFSQPMVSLCDRRDGDGQPRSLVTRASSNSFPGINDAAMSSRRGAGAQPGDRRVAICAWPCRRPTWRRSCFAHDAAMLIVSPSGERTIALP